MWTTIEQSGIAVRPSGYNEYSDDFKAQALTALELNEGVVRLTAKQLGIPEDTLYSWSHGVGISQHVLNLQAGVKGPLADQFEKTARLYLERAQDPEAISKTTGYYGIIGASDAMKSAQLLRGQPTSITENVDRQELLVLIASAVSDAANPGD